MKFDSVVKKYLDTLKENFDDARRQASRWGFNFIDKVDIGDFELGLFVQPGDFYQISLNVKGSNFITDQQLTGVEANPTFWRDFLQVERQLASWIREHDDLPHRIGSMNNRKLRIYKRMIDRRSRILSAGPITDIYFPITVKAQPD